MLLVIIFALSIFFASLSSSQHNNTHAVSDPPPPPNYFITFMVNGEPTVKIMEYGQMPAFSGTPTKASTAEYTYTFSGWSPTLEEVSGNATYTAVFTESVREYDITFIVNGESTVISVEYGELPVFSGSTTKNSTAQYTYTFSGWDTDLIEVDGEATYTAIFTESVREYDITFIVNGVETSQSVAYGEMPAFSGMPTKAATAQYTYAFSGWDTDLIEVDGEATYTAIFTESVNSYEITFIIDGEEVKVNTPFGSAPTPPEVAIKKGYTFTGWDVELANVNGEATYTALWEKNGLSAGAIVGITVGGLALVGAAIIIIVIFKRKKADE